MIDSRNIFGGSTSMSATKAIYSRFNVAGWAGITIGDPLLARANQSGSMTANTLVDIINESGSAGEISQLSISNTGGSTTKTLRVIITVDGTVIYDFTSAAGAAGGVWAGTFTTTSSSSLPPIKYTNSIRVQYASSVTESNGFTSYLARNQVT